ncbi:DUF3958 family protein [Enterococcus sp. BWM-S5]|uniref:DUF3958 family protein n=1 Tax=Enterococcus larvae TaxID=2794352 RepID=A0ABS4CNE6_9ENTE|nr:DUF3958 family protein [Enterococcus larvae]
MKKEDKIKALSKKAQQLTEEKESKSSTQKQVENIEENYEELFRKADFLLGRLEESNIFSENPYALEALKDEIHSEHSVILLNLDEEKERIQREKRSIEDRESDLSYQKRKIELEGEEE